MEIPNYDVDIKNKKFKQLYSFMPNQIFRFLIAGASHTGKTNMLFHVSIEPLIYYDEIHLYAKNLEQDKYQILINKMNEISKQTGHDVMKVSNGAIISIKDLAYEDNQKIIIFDDHVCEKNQKEIVHYFIQGRQKLFCYLSEPKFL